MLEARGLIGLGYDVRTIIAVSERSPETLKWFKSEGVEAEAHPALLDVHVPRGYKDVGPLRALVSETGADVVNLHYGVNHISLKDVLAIRGAGVKKLFVSVHHPTPLEEMPERTHKMTRLASKFCTAVIASTNILHSQMKQVGVAESKIKRVPYSVPAPSSYPDRQESRARLGIPPDAFVISTLARLEVEKGIGDLLKAAANVPDPGGKLRVLVAGTGPAKADLEAQAAERMKDRALFLGRIPDTADLYAASDIFALPSYLEGFGLVYIEAAYHGVPSIGTNVGGIPEAILDGKTGLLVPVRDTKALEEAIQRLWHDEGLRRQLGEAARRRAETEFTEATFADRCAKVLFGK